MKTSYLSLLIIILSSNLGAQSLMGINTKEPKATLDVNGNVLIRDIPTGDSKNDVLTITKEGYINKTPNEFQPPRILSGTIGAVFGTNTLANKTVINKAAIAPIGGIWITKGLNYTVSNPKNGYFIITFNVPFTNIYSASVTMVDSYGSTGTNVPIGGIPNLDIAGILLQTNDNTQIALINKEVLHVKTGDNAGTLKNRSFTFMIMGDNNKL